MRKLIFILIIAGCVAIGYLPQSTTGLLAIALSFLSFALGIYVAEKALNGELLELKKKYYELKYIKDKV